MKPRLIAIGDIHGCATALETLLSAINPTSQDTLVTLGDYVDRGPRSADVIERLIELGSSVRLIPLLGNHELMMKGAFQGPTDLDFWLDCGGEETLESYGGTFDDVPPSHWAFIEHCRHFYETDKYFFVHANYLPNISLNEQPENVLFWEHIVQRIPQPHENGKKAVVGHTPQQDGSIRDLGHLLLLDTYCYGGKWLSAVELNQGHVWQANNKGELYEEDISEDDV